MDAFIIEEMKNIMGETAVKVQEPMAKHTTFRIGGPAACFVTPQTAEQLAEGIQFANEKQIPWYVIGNGSNLLVSDEGVEGIVFCLQSTGKGDLHTIRPLAEPKQADSQDILSKYGIDSPEQDKFYVCAGAGVMLSTLAVQVADHGYAGFAFAGGIPGTLGGAVTMNAGAYGGEIKDVIVGAKVLDRQGKCRILKKEELALSYRHSAIQEEQYIVVEALFAFAAGDAEVIRQEMSDYNRQRREKQPLEYGSAGSTFKRPEGYFAGKLIQDAGLKGYRVGDVMVSDKHSGFVVNVGEGTGAQAEQVITHVVETVEKQFGVHLETEVKRLP